MKLFPSLAALLLSGLVQAAPIHNLVVFGDSLSDNGNLYEMMKHQLPQSPPYYQGRFSNGPVWVENLASSYFSEPANHLQDYAIGGAGVSEEPEDQELFTLSREVETYLLANQDKADPDSLYIIWIGGNNYLGMPEDGNKAVSDVVTGIQHSVEKLVEKGAKNVLLVNLPDLGRTPAALEFDLAEPFRALSMQHNAALNTLFNDLKQNHAGVNWLYFDMQELVTDSIEHAEDYGLSNVTQSCYQPEINESTKKSVLKMAASIKPKLVQNNCDGYLFFDLVHPTAVAHKIISDKVRLMLDNTGVVVSD